MKDENSWTYDFDKLAKHKNDENVKKLGEHKMKKVVTNTTNNTKITSCSERNLNG